LSGETDKGESRSDSDNFLIMRDDGLLVMG
jgi:hypothetical protein